MSNEISIIIISYNAALTIKKVLSSAIQLSDDVIVVDSGSTDKTAEICKEFSVTFIKQTWLGYGKQKNVGNALARYEWVLSLDADEVLSEALVEELKKQTLQTKHVYSIPFKNIYCGKAIHFGRWKNERHIRLFQAQYISWDENPVHEELKLADFPVLKLNHPIKHYSMNSKADHYEKAKKYAMMGAQKLHLQGKKASLIKQYINPIFRFVKDYIFNLGFLDGKLGLQIAIIIAKETYWKYRNLKNWGS